MQSITTPQGTAAQLLVMSAACWLSAASSVFSAEVCTAQWDGTIGQSGMNALVRTLTVYNGDLIAGGTFTTAGGQTVNRIARWDGTAWHPFTSGGQIGVNGNVNALTVYNGDLIAAGSFTTAGGHPANRIARWDGSRWHPFISGGQNGVSGGSSTHVTSLIVRNGRLIVAGEFVWAGEQTVNRIASWDGSAWFPLSSGGQVGVNQTARALAVSNGDLIVGGSFTTAGGQTVNRIARWADSAWHPLTSGGQIGVNQHVRALTEFNGDLIAGGSFTTAGGQTVNRIARWDGSAWHPFIAGGQTGVSSQVRALAAFNGDLIIGGFFSTAGGQTATRIARWDGSAWHSFASCGQTGVNSDGPPSTTVESLISYNGDLIVGGQFTSAGGQTANSIAITELHCIPIRGACCVNGVAVQLLEDECDNVGGLYHGEGVDSDEVVCDPHCFADLDGDGVVDGYDLLILLEHWGSCADHR